MANIATCPQCAKQLGLPASVALTDQAECPKCLAKFSLSEAVQISLPVARILEPSESQVPPAVMPSPPAVSAAPQKSWEQRLKDVLATDSEDETVAAAPEKTNEIRTTDKAVPESSPSFDFELDREVPKREQTKPQPLGLGLPEPLLESAPKKSLEPAVEQTTAKTLADFEAAADIPALDLDPPAPESFDVQNEVRQASKLPKKLERTVVQLPVALEQTVSARRIQRRPFPIARSQFPKVAALAAGPVLGSVLGLYGLLWLQGEKADYVGLSHVLPTSLLPAEYGKPREESPLVETNLPEVLKHDGEVRPASASVPMPSAATPIVSTPMASTPMVSTARINVDEFHALVDAAEAALPNFVTGDLSMPGAHKRKGQAYMALCRLAEHVDFAKQPALAPTLRAKGRQAKQLFQRAIFEADDPHDLAHISGSWWEHSERPNSGIFLAGKVQEAESAGGGTLCFVKLSEQANVPVVGVWCKTGRYQNGDQIGVVGRVVTEPSEHPPGVSYGPLVHAEYSFALESSH